MNLIELYLISGFYSQIWLNIPSKEAVDYIENVSVDYKKRKKKVFDVDTPHHYKDSKWNIPASFKRFSTFPSQSFCFLKFISFIHLFMFFENFNISTNNIKFII